MLEVVHATVSFGALKALDDVTVSVSAGQVLGLIGPNGAGKTTMLNAITGLYPLATGTITLDGVQISGMSRNRLARLGISRTYQNLALFKGLSVLDNVLVGGAARGRGGLLTSALGLMPTPRAERRARADAIGLLDRFGLAPDAGRSVGELPYGVLKRVELARALAARPKVLLLDEPAAGLSHEDIEHLVAELRGIQAAESLTLVLVEHHMGLVRALCDSVVVLNYGRRLAAGTPDEVTTDPAVVEAYLGSAA
ncbi:MAG TPA: ABC transporter ATP-binding protein [Amycolatopsis sp.]|nr:ABC transporter ATP-binding protein [Amycolatopsis sp.]